MPKTTQAKIEKELQDIADLPEKHKVVEAISQRIEQQITQKQDEEKHFQEQVNQSKINIFEQNRELTRNLEVNKDLHKQIIAQHQAQQEQKTISQLQAEHEAKIQKKHAEEQCRLSRRKKHSLAKKSKNMLNPSSSMKKKFARKIPVVGGAIVAGMSTIGFLEFIS